MLLDSGSQEVFPCNQSSSMQSPSFDSSRLQGMGSQDILSYSQFLNASIISLPKCWNQQATDDLLMTVNRFIKTFVSASGASQGSIDNRIEQAMDLVKSHLMSAVRSEVEELRDKISKLEETVNHLSRENEVLRANVAPEVLASLTGGVRVLGISGPAQQQLDSQNQPNQPNNNQH